MAIREQDVKIVASQVMDDVPEGGGAPTSTVIIDGASNQVFPDISERDRAGGDVAMRKVFLSVQTDDTDTYLGANLIIAEPPTDPNVSVTMFTTKDGFDIRDSARTRIEAYLAPGPEWSGFLFENHIEGQRTLQIFMRPSARLPDVGHTYLLVANEGLSSQRLQYVRVTEVSSETRTFTYNGDQDYQAMVVTMGISDRLRYDFAGSPASRSFERNSTKTITRDTVVADASVYCGVSLLTELVSIGNLKARVESIFTQLVPSAQTEIPVIDATAAGNTESLIDAANGTASITTSTLFSPGSSAYLGNAIYPGTLNIGVTGGTLTDDNGELLAGTTVVGTVNYAKGVIVFASTSPSYTGIKTMTFKPAGAPLQLADSAAIDVVQGTRAFNYNITIPVPPAPGTTTVSYRANGAWYELRDTGGGNLKGANSAFGAGRVNFTTGTISVSLNVLPDDSTQIIFNWGARVNYLNRAAVPTPPLKVTLQLAHVGVAPGTFTLSWDTPGGTRTVTDNGHGALTGFGTGTIRYQTGEVNLVLAALPSGGQEYTASYSYGSPVTQAFPAPLREIDGTVHLLLSQTDVKPGTVELTWNVVIENYDAISTTPAEMQFRPKVDPYKTVRDNGSGRLLDADGTDFGSVNYVTGAIVLTVDLTISVPYPRYQVEAIGVLGGNALSAFAGAINNGTAQTVYRNTFSHFEYIPAAASMPTDESGLVTVLFRGDNADTTVEEVFTAGGLSFDITASYSEDIVPGSVNFTLGGKTYFDRLGILLYDLDVATGSAIAAGTVNYLTGDVKVTAWVPAATPSIVVHSLLTTMDGKPVDDVTFRVPVAPVRVGSFQLLATKLTGGTINVTAANTGQISGSGVMGYINYETGVVRLRFGAFVTAAGNESEIWYDADAIRSDGKILKPAPVFAETIRYNAVAYTYLPLDADLLGLDPVRLPQDGRVPIFRKGGYNVIGHKADTEPQTVSNGTTINTGRVRLSRVRVLGADDGVITTGYTHNLEAGTVTFTDVTGYSQPVRVEHRVEDLLVCSDVQIDGELTFTRQITHAYPVGSYVSSALMADDLKARVSIFFDQSAPTPGGAWADTVTGSVAAASYNNVANPMVVTNRGAQTERWALQFTTPTAFQIIGEHVGIIGLGSTTTPTAPINPATGTPYFTLSETGWGIGWVAGNVLRFNTVGALFSTWLVRTVQQGAETVLDDSFTLLARGDVNRP